VIEPSRGAWARSSLLLLTLLICWQLATSARAEEHSRVPRVYLDCGRDCVDDFYRQALSYFDYVRDRHQADYAIYAVMQLASNGGALYTVTLRHVGEPDGVPIVRVVSTQADDSLATTRTKILDAVLRCLHEALRGTPHEAAFKLALPRRSGQALTTVEDGWNHWVISPELLANVEGESNYYWMELLAALSLRRITESSKLRSLTEFTRRETSYVLEDDERVTGHVNDLSQRLLYAHSIGAHWALGGLGVAATSKFENTKLHLHGGPVVEWNLFPYEENASRQLRAAYQAGVWHTRYFERTVYDRMQETRPYHALSLIVDLNQAWGSVQAVLQGNSFIDEPKRWRLALGLVFSLSLFSGLALQFEGEAALIEDQIGLRDRELTEREIFLETLQLPTEVSFNAMLGFSYTFGSVHNTIVNPRFGRVDLEEE
jgi:hypothetical protein